MRARSSGNRRIFSLLTASALGCGAVLGAGATPAAAAVGSPTDLTTSGKACATEAPGPYLSPVLLNDADAVVLQGSYSGTPASAEPEADFQVWDVTKPAEPQQWRDGVDEEKHRVYIQLEDPARQLDGVTYAWRVRVLDGEDASPWSGTCYFTVDRTGGEQPAIVSTDYPAGDWDHAAGEPGVPGTFTFTSVSGDTESYQYRFYSSETGGDDYTTVAATTLGGPATVTWTPKGAGGHSVRVYAVDRAGNTSEQGDYDFWVRDTRPSIWSSAYPDWSTNLDYNIGVPGAFDFTANIADTESFAWRIDDDGPSGAVAANDDGKATVMIAPAKAGRQTLYVQSVTRDGKKHPARAYEFLVDNAPKVTGDLDRSVIIGSSLAFHFAPRMPDVEAYLYWHRDYDGEHPDKKITVPARADGTADLTWTANNETEDTQALLVQSRSADGTLSEPRRLFVSVSGASPTVTRKGGDSLGSEATFTARTEMANVKEYEVLLNRDQATKQVIPAAADGTATFRFTPAERGYNYVTVVARNTAGVRTSEGGTSWSVSDSPVVTSTDFPASGGKIAPGTFTFKPRQTGAAKYEYRIDGSYLTVPAAVDGTATVSWTPEESGYYSVSVHSMTASGARSMDTDYSFYVAPDPLTVTAVTPSSVAKGGVRTFTITGSGLSQEYRIAVKPAGGSALPATVKSVTADRKTATIEVDLTTAAEGKASVSVRENDWTDPVTLADAFTITATPALLSTTAPAITGTAAVSSTLRASTGGWTPAAATHTYQWTANGTAISGANSATYVIPPAQLGKRLTVTVTAAKPDYTPAQATSTATAAVAKGAAPRATTAPKITGTARVDYTLQANTGTWSPTVDSYRYEWRVGGTLNSNTTKSLKLTAAMRDKAVTVTVIAVKAGYTDGRAASPAVTVRQ